MLSLWLFAGQSSEWCTTTTRSRCSGHQDLCECVIHWAGWFCCRPEHTYLIFLRCFSGALFLLFFPAYLICTLFKLNRVLSLSTSFSLRPRAVNNECKRCRHDMQFHTSLSHFLMCFCFCVSPQTDWLAGWQYFALSFDKLRKKKRWAVSVRSHFFSALPGFSYSFLRSIFFCFSLWCWWRSLKWGQKWRLLAWVLCNWHTRLAENKTKKVNRKVFHSLLQWAALL